MSRATVLFWAIFAVTMAVYLTMVLWSLPHLQQLAGGLMVFDLRPLGYSLPEARGVVAALGAEGANFYLNVQLWLDLAFPGLLAIVLVLAFRKLAKGWLASVLSAGAILMAAFDYLENRGVAAMLRAGADALTDEMVRSASRWTVMKSASSTVVFVALLLLLLLAGWRRIKRR